MEIVQADVQDEDASEVLRQVHSAVQTSAVQRPTMVDTSEPMHTQLESAEMAILPGPGDAAPGMFPWVEWVGTILFTEHMPSLTSGWEMTSGYKEIQFSSLPFQKL